MARLTTDQLDKDYITTITGVTPAPATQQVGPGIGVNTIQDQLAAGMITPAEARKKLAAASSELASKTTQDVAAATKAVRERDAVIQEAATNIDTAVKGLTEAEDTVAKAARDTIASDPSAAQFFSPSLGGTLNLDPLIEFQRQQAEAARKDAFALLQDVFNQYGLGELAGSIRQLMESGVGANEAALLLKTDPAYNGPYLKRFAGNVARQKAGLNVLSEAEYINLENQYSNLMHAYGVKNLATRDEFASLIGNDVAPTEVNKRLDLAVTQVQNADPNIKASLQQYYPQLKDNDLVSYMLNPEKTLPALQEMVTTGQINAAAMQQQGLSQLDLTRAQQLARLGVDQQAARTGFEKVATVLPTGQKLGQIYGEAAIPYSQTTAEQEFLEGNASAARKRRQLAQLEEGSFSGKSGVDTGQGSSLGKSILGKY